MKTTFFVILAAVVPYFLTAFEEWDMNAKNWSVNYRGFTAGCGLAFGITTLIACIAKGV